MGTRETAGAGSFKRRVVRGVSVVCLLAAIALIAAEWIAQDLGMGQGVLISAGLALCLAANLLSGLLLLGRRAS